MVDARNTALKVLITLERGDQTLDGILDDIAPATRSLSRRDRSLFNALIYGVLRWRGRLDYIISHFSNTPLKKIEPGVLNILRLGLFQIIYLDRIPDSATVNTCGRTHPAASVLPAQPVLSMRCCAEPPQIIASVVFPALKSDPVAFFSAAHSLPAWLARRWLHRYDPETLTALCDTINSHPADYHPDQHP